jgi:hypothetical protein
MYKTSTPWNLQISLRKTKGFNFKSKRLYLRLHHLEPCAISFLKKNKKSKVLWIKQTFFNITTKRGWQRMNTFKYIQVHSNTFKYIEIHHKYTIITFEYTQNTFKYIQVHSNTFKYIQIYHKYTISTFKYIKI